MRSRLRTMRIAHAAGPWYDARMSITIPLVSDPSNYDQQVALEGAEYTLVLDWNARAGVWSLTMRTQDGEPIIEGHPLVVNRPVLRSIPRSVGLRPPGELVLVRAQTGGDIAVDDLGTNEVRLVYFTRAEVLASRS